MPLYHPKFRPKIRVATQNDEPFKVFHRYDWLAVTQILDQWAEVGQWWRNEHEKMFWRLQLEDDQVMEIFQDLVTGEWWLYKVWD